MDHAPRRATLRRDDDILTPREMAQSPMKKCPARNCEHGLDEGDHRVLTRLRRLWIDGSAHTLTVFEETIDPHRVRGMPIVPEPMFLDIQMPGLTGLEVAKEASRRCHVVFVTAYDKYAVAG